MSVMLSFFFANVALDIIICPAPLLGEPLAKPFTLLGLPKPLLQGEVARRRRDGEVVQRRACPL